jgi:hypothetical protein
MVVLAVLPAAVVAQSIRGVVLDHTQTPTPGVVVQLVDTASTIVARALSNAAGEFRLVAPAAGTYRVRTLRIGFRPELSAPLALAVGADVRQRFVLAGTPISLDTVRVSSRSPCRAFGDSTAAAYVAWDQARTALTAAQLTAATHTVFATTVAYERTLDANGRRIRQQRSSSSSGYVTQPWLALSPDSLHRMGYVVTDHDNATIYYAPGLETLLAPSFVEDHCFRLTTEQDRVGIAFEPSPDRHGIAEIRGTLWLDRATATLQRLDFGYANVSAVQAARAGGDMTFVRMADGAWVISGWTIRMPVLETEGRPLAIAGTDTHVREIRVSGGELALARRGADTLWAHAPLVLLGTVVDSTSGDAVSGARVQLVGTTLDAVADFRGQFRVAGVLPGDYTLEVHTASLDSVSAVQQRAVTVTDSVTDSVTPLVVRVPTAGQISATVCGRATSTDAGIVVGSLTTVTTLAGDSAASRGATVTAEWQIVGLRAEGASVGVTSTPRWRSVRADARGAFRLCGVPVNTALVLTAETDGARATAVEVRIPPNGRFARAELVLEPQAVRTAVFTGTVLVDSTRQPVVGAQVTLPELARTTLTNERGMFRLADLPPGVQHVLVRRIGYGALDTHVAFEAGQTADHDVYLSRVTLLDSVVTTARLTDWALDDFEANRKLGLGHFITRDDLAKHEGVLTASVLQQIPGLQIVGGHGTHAWIRSTHGAASLVGGAMPDMFDQSRGAPSASCWAQVYLDDVLLFGNRITPDKRFEPLFDVNSIAPSQIESIEYYAGPAQTPAKYSMLNSACGVLVIHTRRPP